MMGGRCDLVNVRAIALSAGKESGNVQIHDGGRAYGTAYFGSVSRRPAHPVRFEPFARVSARHAPSAHRDERVRLTGRKNHMN